MGIENKFPQASNEVFHKFFLYLQKWRILLKENDAKFLDVKLEVMKTWLTGFDLEAND